MALEFRFPDVGEGIHEAELVEWLVHEGEAVKEDQPLANVETDKAIVEIPSPRAGVVLKLNFKSGDVVKVGQVFAVIGEKGEKVAAAAGQVAAAGGEKTGLAETKKVATEKTAEGGASHGTMAAGVLGKGEGTAPALLEKPAERVLATPHTRMLARELGVDIRLVNGSGPHGRVTVVDVARAAKAGGVGSGGAVDGVVGGGGAGAVGAGARFAYPKELFAFERFGAVERLKLKGVRKKISEHMALSMFTATHVAHMDEADVTRLAGVREREKAGAEEKGVKLTYLAFIVKAVAAALKNHPLVNASLDETTGEIVLKKYYNIGIAVDSEDGLMVPVVKDADKKSVLEIAREISGLAGKARARTLALEEMRGGTFTVTNVGSIGGVFSTPIINYPEAAILGVHRIQERPFVEGDEIALRKMLPLSLSFDHRILDGADAARFMNEIIRHLEDPDLMLVDVI